MLQLDLQSILVTVVGFLLAVLGKRAVTGIDKNISDARIEAKEDRREIDDSMTIIHSRITALKGELQSDIKDLRIDVKDCKNDISKLRDKMSDTVTAVRLDLEDKMQIQDTRLRDLEKGKR